jgi:tetratricopeptide (TPR) repeat protein
MFGRFALLATLLPLLFLPMASYGADPVDACRNVQQPAKAQVACSAIIKHNTSPGANLAWAFNNRGLANAALGSYLSAIEDYGKAIEIDPKLAAAYSNRGNAHAALGDMTRALADHTAAVELDPTYVAGWHNRAVDHEEMGAYDAALADYRTALRLDPRHRGSQIGLATANCKLSRINASAEARLSAIRSGLLDVMTMQELLMRAGHYSGPIDGKFGKLSRRALWAWTRDGCGAKR